MKKDILVAFLIMGPIGLFVFLIGIPTVHSFPPVPEYIKSDATMKVLSLENRKNTYKDYGMNITLLKRIGNYCSTVRIEPLPVQFQAPKGNRCNYTKLHTLDNIYETKFKALQTQSKTLKGRDIFMQSSKDCSEVRIYLQLNC